MNTTTDWDVYCAFRQAQAEFLSRPYTLPKNWEKFKKRLTEKNLACLEQATRSAHILTLELVSIYLVRNFHMSNSLKR